jgi:Flp pilus assembly pilin Flp
LRGDAAAVTALEYGIIAAFLGVALVGIFVNFGKFVTALFSTATSSL